MVEFSRPWSGIAAVAFILGAALYPVALERPSGAVRGQLYLESGAAAGPDASVTLVDVKTGGSQDFVLTAKDGSFVFRKVPPGDYIVQGLTPVHTGQSEPFSVSEGRTTRTQVTLVRNRRVALELEGEIARWSPESVGYLEASGYFDSDTATSGTLELTVVQMPIEGLRRGYWSNEWSNEGEFYQSVPQWQTEARKRQRAVTSGTVQLSTARWTREFRGRIPLPRLEPGAYEVELQLGPIKRRCAVVVSDLMLVVHMDTARVIVMAAHMRTGQPMEGVTLRVPGRGVEIVTDAQGLAVIDELRGEDLMVVGDSSVGPARVELARWGLSGRRRVCVYTDRPVYRPGQSVHFKGVVREKRGQELVPISGLTLKARLEDPSGVVQGRMNCSVNQFGTFSGTFLLSSECPTGPATIFVEGPDIAAATEVPIVAYRKPEVELSLRPDRTRYVAGESATFDLQATYLYGAPVVNGRVSYEVWLLPDSKLDGDWMEGEDGYAGDVYSTYGRGADTQLLEGEVTTDRQGRARVRVPIMRDMDGTAPQRMRLELKAFVKDEQGRYAEATARADVYRAPVVLTLQDIPYVASTSRPVQVVARLTDWDDRPMSGETVVIEASRSGAPSERVRSTPLRATAVSDEQGVLVAALKLRTRGAHRIDCKYRASNGQVVVASAGVWVMDASHTIIDTDGPPLRLLTDKKQYANGERAHVVVQSSCVGSSALLTSCANGIIRHALVPLRPGNNVVEFPIQSVRASGVELAASCVYRGRVFEAKKYLRVANPDARLDVQVRPQKEVCKPGETVPVQVSVRDRNGKPVVAEISVAVVDEGIYRVREDDPAFVARVFYGSGRGELYTADSGMIHALLDEGMAPPKGIDESAVRQTFADTAFWRAHVLTGADGTTQVAVPLPDNITRWRITARAITEHTAVGYGTASLTARLPFHVQLIRPRFLTVGDTAYLEAAIRNGTARALEGTIELQGGGDCIAIEGSRRLAFEVGPSRTASLSWRVKSIRPGTARFLASARTSDGELQDAMRTAMEVLPRVRARTLTRSGQLSKEAVHEIAIDPEAAGAPATLTLRVNATPLACLGTSLEYLIQYPYGCTEQTVSSFLPDLLISRLLQSPDARLRQLIRQALPKAVIQKLPSMVRTGVTRLAAMQQAEGGWGWWERGDADPWLTAYGLMALAEAQRSGYEVPRLDTFDWIRQAAEMGRRDPDTAAFLQLALAMGGHTDVDFQKDVDKMGAPGLAATVIEDVVKGRQSEAGRRAYIRLLALANRSEPGHVYWDAPKNRPEWWSREVATAMALRALLLRNPRAPEVDGALRYLMSRRTDQYWVSTRDTAFILMALVEYIQRFPLTAKIPRSMVIMLNDREAGRLSIDPAVGSVQEQVLRVRLTNLRAGKNILKLRADGEGRPFYGIAVTAYLSRGLESGAAARDDLKVVRSYSLAGSGSGGRGRTAATPTTVRSGDGVRVRLTLTVKRDMTYVIIRDPLPAGLEPLGTTVDYMRMPYWCQHLDMRDDHVAAFAVRLPKGEHTLEYVLRAGRRGTYTALPVRMEGMYGPEQWAESSVNTVVVR